MSSPMAEEAAKARPVVPVYPFILGVFPILRLYAANADRIAFRYTLLPLGLVLLGLLVLFGIFRGLTKDSSKAALLVAAWAALFFSYGRLRTAIHLSHAIAWPIWVAVAVGFGVAIFRTEKSFKRFTVPLNVFALALAIVAIAPARASWGGKAYLSAPVALKLPASPPDVYYIILDAYGRDDTLQRFYGFDNAPFLGELRKRGFVVPRGSRSNYLYTILSLPSSLNMDYLDALRPPQQTQTPVWLKTTGPLNDLVENNRVARSLKAAGYRYVDLPSGLSFTNQSDLADVNYGSRYSLREFNTMVGQTTMLAPWFNDELEQVSPGDLLHLQSILLSAPQIQGPKFVFAHFLSPHPPYQFKADGSPANPAPPGVNLNWEDRKGYTEQIRYLNAFVLKAVDKIVRESKTPPVIIIQGDHGPALRDDTPTQNSLEPWTATNFQVRSGIFNAYLVPPEVRAAIPGDVTPVNSFRIVFRELFKADLPILPNETWYSKRASLTTLSPVPKGLLAEPKTP